MVQGDVVRERGETNPLFFAVYLGRGRTANEACIERFAGYVVYLPKLYLEIVPESELKSGHKELANEIRKKHHLPTR